MLIYKKKKRVTCKRDSAFFSVFIVVDHFARVSYLETCKN